MGFGMRCTSVVGTIGLALLGSVGCGDDSGTGGTGGTGGGPAAGPTVDIVVDADRNGVADAASEADQAGEMEYQGNVGALFLPNLDDDDSDGYRDSDDVKVAGNGDELDLATFKLTACEDCPKGSTGLLEIDAESAKNVRIFAFDPAAKTWALVAGETNWCMDEAPECTPVASWAVSSANVKAGVTLGIEARDVIRSTEVGWIGVVDLKYSVTDADGNPVTSDGSPKGEDTARMRVAPWVLFGNISPFDRVWSSDDSSVFVEGVAEGAEAAGVAYDPYGNYGDQWTQDFFQTGYWAMPRAGENGEVVSQGMAVGNARPWGRNNSDNQLPIRWLMKNYLAPDKAVLQVYKTNHTGDSYDSHGNHDLIPPYENGSESFPLGRILIGSGVLKETRTFYNAQGAQSPYYTADTSWLLVGHVDEYLSYAPASTERGWKLLVGSPRLAREMLEDAQAAGNGDAVMHEGKEWYDFNTGGEYPADITIDEVLADTELMAGSQSAQAAIDDEVGKLQEAIGLADDEIIEIPFLIGSQNFGGTKVHIAYQPGTVNMLVMGDVAVIPKPFGPKIGGEDIFEADLQESMGSGVNKLGKDGKGMTLVFADDWDFYHRLDGEVHCGTNPEASAPFTSLNWWETDR